MGKHRKPTKVETNSLCEFGCGQIAKYITLGGKFICEDSTNKCPFIRNKNSNGLKRAHNNFPDKWNHKNGENFGPASKNWRIENPEKYYDIRKKAAKTFHENYITGKYIPYWKGKKLPNEMKEKISYSMQGVNNGFIKTNWYEVFCPFINDLIKVQGTWELKYANYLNDNKILWTRGKTKRLKYKLFENDYLHTYTSDFFLIDTEEYIEIKGYWWKSKDGRVDDKRKMEAVKEYNKNKKIIILQKEDLLKLGLNV